MKLRQLGEVQMGMALSGGAADKLGNAYERRFTVLAMLDLLMGKATSLRVEVPGDAGAGAEFRLRDGAVTKWTQSKRQRSSGPWTLSALLRENFLQDWLRKLQDGDICTFSSTTSADDLRQLCDSAVDAVSLDEFETQFLTADRRRKFEQLRAAWGVDNAETYRLLKQIQVVTIDDERLDNLIETELTLLVTGNLRAARRVLLHYADEIIHREVTAKGIWEFLRGNGIEQRSAITTPSESSEARRLADWMDRLPPVTHGRIAVAVTTDGGSTRRLVRILAEEPSPQNVLRGWAERPPAWLAQADWDTQLAAAELAGAYGVLRLQADLFTGLVEQQCPPREFWAARAAIAETMRDDQPASPESLDRLLSLGRLEHPYATAVAALFDSRLADARQALSQWTPEDPADRTAKALLALQLELGNPVGEDTPPDAVTRALAVSRDLLENGWFPGVAIWRARQMTLLARQRGTKILFGDLREAQELALRVRQDRRAFRGESASAAAAACEAAAMRGDLDFVLRTGLPQEHGGDATDAEFRHSEVALSVALAALQRNQFDLAEVAAAHVTSPFHRTLIKALRAQVRQEDSALFWREAVTLAADDMLHLIQALNGLARTGAADLPRLEELRATQPDAAVEIQATAEIHAGNYERSIALLRVQRRESITAAMTLAEAYRSTGATDSAAHTLLDAADDFSDPHLRLEAAILYARVGQKDRAQSIITALIQDRDPDWPEFLDVLRFAVQLALDKPDLDLAIKHCRQILREEPGDSTTRWALINSLVVLDQMSDAWQALRSAPEDLRPDTRVQGKMWVELHRRFSDPATLLRGSLRVVRMFPDDEELSASILASIMMHKPSDDPVPADLLAEYHQELERFFERWPNSPGLRRIRTANDELLIEALAESVRLTPERLAERNRLNREFYRGEKPLIVLAQYSGRSYSEILIRRGVGVLPVVHPDARESEQCRQTVRLAIDKDVAIDASAIAVLSTLPQDIQRAAMAVFRRVRTTEEVARDAREYEEDLSRTRAVLYYNPATDGPGLTELTDDETAAAKNRLAAMQGLIGTLWRRPIQPESSRGLRRLGVHASVAHLGATEGTAVWCDDAATRLTLRGIGIATFSTVAVVEHLLMDGTIPAIRYQGVLDTLVRERIGNLGLDEARIVRIAQEEKWQAASAASCLAQPQAWADHAATAERVVRVLAICHRENPEQVASWLHAAVFGAVLRCPTTRKAIELAGLLLAASILSLSAHGELARNMVLASRAAVIAGLPVDNPANVDTDILPTAAQHMRTQLLANSSIAADHVFPLILDWLGALDEQDFGP